MSKTHWRKILTTSYLGGFDLDDGKGKFNEITATIKQASTEKVKDQNGKEETCLVLQFQERIKPMILNVTNSKTLEKLSGSKYVEDWAGLRIQIGTEKVRAFGGMHDALRIRNFPPASNALSPDPIVPCTDCGETIKGTDKASAATVIEKTEKTYGQALCLTCAKKWREQQQSEKNQDEADLTADQQEAADV